MPETRFEKGTTYEAIEHMHTAIRPIEREDFESAYPSVREGLLAASLNSDSLVTGYLGEESVAIFGVVRQSDRSGIPWLALAQESDRHPFHIARSARAWVSVFRSQYSRLANYVPAEDFPAISLLQFCGFQVEPEIHKDRGMRYRAFWAEGVGTCASL